MSTPLCPRDGSSMTLTRDVLGPGTEAHVCPKCAGVLVDWKQGQPFFSRWGVSVQDLHGLVQHASRRSSAQPPLACTACQQGPMQPFTLRDVELDLCEQCGACWLDRGELGRVTKGTLGASVATPKGVAGETSKVVGVYEMFWDCAFCDTRALLGQTHRYCPQCGAPQDPAKRYFPPAGQEVKANVEYDGADKSCPACQTPNGAKAQNCRHCGSPLSGAQEVRRVADRSTGAPPPPAQRSSPPRVKGRRWWPYLLGTAVGMCFLFGAVAMLWKKDVTVTVASHAWAREIDVESLQAVNESAWCDSMPSDAYRVSRSREQRSTRKLPDGETCTTRDVDRGNGTFERRQECRPKYREEPIYDDHCSYTVDRWRTARTAKANGRGQQPAPAWPRVSLSRTGVCLGCEREGSRRETYSLELTGADGKGYQCRVSASKWTAVADGTTKPIKVGVLTGAADCDQL